MSFSKKNLRGGSVNSGRGDTVRLRIALWEGKGMGETLETCTDLLALPWLQRSYNCTIYGSWVAVLDAKLQ